MIVRTSSALLLVGLGAAALAGVIADGLVRLAVRGIREAVI